MAMVERMNNKIKLIKRKTRVSRDKEMDPILLVNPYSVLLHLIPSSLLSLL